MKLEHKKLNVVLNINPDFTQAQYEQYQELLLEKGKDSRSGATYQRLLIECAQESKIITDIEGDVTRPVVVKWLTECIRDVVKEALEIPPNE